MPTKRRLRAPQRIDPPSPYQIAYLLDLPLPEATAEDTWWSIVQAHADHPGSAWADRSAAALWRRWGADLLPLFVREHPGQRPGIWWTTDAPEPRRRLGGVGTPRHEVLAVVARYGYGIPAAWLTPAEVACHRRSDSRFRGVAIAPDAPPLFESEAAYLRRHKLLLPGEARRLRCVHFKPVVIQIADDGEPTAP